MSGQEPGKRLRHVPGAHSRRAISPAGRGRENLGRDHGESTRPRFPITVTPSG